MNETLSDWGRVIESMVQNACREHERWRQAAWTAAGGAGLEAVGRSTPSPVVNHLYLNMSRCNVAANELGIALLLERVGRDVSNLEGEILRCFDRNGAHRSSTIIGRLFKGYEPSWEGRRLVETTLRAMVKDGRLMVRSHERTHEDLFLLATPERIAQKAAEKAARLKEEAAEKVAKVRQEAIVELLHKTGYKSAKAHKYSDEIVTLTVNDLERLLGVTSAV